MKTRMISLFVLFLVVVGCAPTRPVTLIGSDNKQYIGRINYNRDGLTGILTIEVGPNGEKYTGPYAVVDRTATSRAQGGIIAPQGKQLPAVGSVQSASSGSIDAVGYWYGTGDKGSTIDCVLQIGLGGHGHGACKDCNGLEYQILRH